MSGPAISLQCQPLAENASTFPVWQIARAFIYFLFFKIWFRMAGPYREQPRGLAGPAKGACRVRGRGPIRGSQRD